MFRIKYLFFVSFLLSLTYCSKKDDETAVIPTAPLTITVDHNVDGDDVFFYNLTDSRYKNLAGNIYEITRLEYYLSGIKFLKSNGNWYAPSSTPYLINVENGLATFLINKVEVGEYQAVSLMIGIPPTQNTSGMLDNTLDNLNMAWPESLGGGYHFMKFEGNYIDDQNIVRGFTVHLGNENMQSINELNTSVSITQSGLNQVDLNMNLNEWFESPHLYDFNIDGNYTMAVDSLMKKVSENGRNALSIE